MRKEHTLAQSHHLINTSSHSPIFLYTLQINCSSRQQHFSSHFLFQVKIKLPNTNPSEIKIDIQEMILDLRTPNK